MEYIEPKPVEVDKKKKTRKKVIAGVTCGLLAAGLAVGAYFLISKVFIEYDKIELYTFKYDDSDPSSGATIAAVKESAELPKKLRLPGKYKKHPIVGIEDSVFLERKEIQEIILPDSIESIGTECFLGCENLAKINVPKNLETIGTDAFTRTAWYESFPSGDIVQFGEFLYSFKGQMSPHSAVLADRSSPKASEYSGNKVYLADFSHYSQGVFKDQKNLEYAELPSTMSGVPVSFFEGCNALEDIDLPSSLGSIGSYSFRNCSNLHINGFNNLTHLTSIGDYALASTKLSGDIIFNNIVSEVGEGVFSGCTSLTSVTVGDSFKNIPNEFVSGCTSLTALNLPDREQTIQSHIGFIGEHALSQTKITSFRIPFNVSTVRNGAFKECDLLTTVYAYQNLEGSNLNRFDTEAKEWVVTDSLQGIQAIEKECFKDSPVFKGLVLVNSNNTVISSDIEVNFPKTLSYLGSINERSDLFTGTNVNFINFADTKITTIAPNLCEDAVHLSAVNFGYSQITKFNVEAFKGCVSLTDVIIPDSVKTIEAGLFEGCVNLASVRLSKNTSTIPDYVFKNCSSLTSIRIPLGYKGFGIESFAGCTSLASVVFEENIYNKTQVFANIGQGCFDGCSSLTSIIIPNSCKQYASDVLKGTTSLSTVVLSNKTTLSTVGESMFEDSSIQSIYLTSNYNKIGKNAFKNSSLKSIALGRSSVVKVENANAFTGVTLEHIYVPTDLVDQYKNTNVWSEYASAIEGADYCTVSFAKGDYGKGTMGELYELAHGFIALPANEFSSTDDNKVFKCWKIDSTEYQPGTIIPLTADTTVTAIWEDATPATISYNANGGTGTMASDTANVGESFQLPECTFTREGYEFGGWMVTGETMLHDSGDIFTVNGDVEVKPLWKEVDDSGDTPVDPEEGGEESGETSKEEEAKKFPVAAIIIIAIAGTAVVGVALFYIIRAIVVKKIYG